MGTRRIEQWRDNAKCRGLPSYLFYPSDEPGGVEAAKEFCQSCPVKSQCKEEALREKEQYGVWGGLSERERRRIAKRRRRVSELLSDTGQIPRSAPESVPSGGGRGSRAPSDVCAQGGATRPNHPHAGECPTEELG